MRSGRYFAAAALFALVVLIGLAVHAGWTTAFDSRLLLGLAAPPRLIVSIAAVTWLGDSLARAFLTVLAAMMLLLIGRDWRRALALVLIVSTGAMLNAGVKEVVMRARPDLLRHLDAVTTSSFPSGHAANSAILYLALALLAPPRHRRAATAIAAALVLAIGVSRVALAVHWPSDVLAGWCLGIGWLLLWRHALATAAPG